MTRLALGPHRASERKDRPALPSMFIPLLTRIRQLFREDGVRETLTKGLAYAYREGLRPRLPTRRRVAYAGIPTAIVAKAGDKWVPNRWVPDGVCDIPDYEAALLGEIDRLVRPGDRVVVVGGGVGVTATAAARRAGAEGHVHVFEGGAGGVRAVRQTARLNGVGDHVTVEHAVVGRAIQVYGRRPAPIVPPTYLPDCDVLELDCEGAEVDILREMTARPRVIIVETHGLYGASTNSVAALLDRIGYDPMVVGLAEPRLAALCEEGDIRVIAAERRAP